MRLRQIALISACTLVAAVPASPATTHKPVRKAAAKAAPAKHPKPVPGQRTIEDNRAAEIQAALVKVGYLTSPSGHWDDQTENAMTKFQADNGWQTKWVPDSRAIIKLGLGPSSSSSASSHYISPSINLHQNYIPVEVYSAYKPYDPSAPAVYAAPAKSSAYTAAPAAASYTAPSSTPPHPPTYTARVASNGYTAPAASAPRAITTPTRTATYAAAPSSASYTPAPARVVPPAPAAAAASSPYPTIVKPTATPKPVPPTITADASSDGLE